MGNNTYIRVYHHLVWGTKNRMPFIVPEFREGLYRYIGGTMVQKKLNLIAIGGTADHIHIFFGAQRVHDVPEIVCCIKANSSQLMRCKNNPDFAWQNGYGWFSCSKKSIDGLTRYILNQEAHHKKESFDDEIEKFLKA